MNSNIVKRIKKTESSGNSESEQNNDGENLDNPTQHTSGAHQDQHEIVMEDYPHPLHNYLVCEKIFSFLDASDLLNCMSTCTLWESYLKPKKNEVLLKKVLSVSMNRMTKHDFLHTRLVSRKWNNDVIQLYENYPDRVKLKTLAGSVEFSFIDEETGRRTFYRDHGMRFDTPKIENFLREMNSHPGNPFVGRAVRVIIQNDYWTGVRPLLARFGEHIWYANLSFDDDENPDRETDRIESRIRDSLTLLPNLKFLRFDIGGYEDEHEVGFRNRLPEFMRTHPFPRLQHLESFSYSTIRNPIALIDAIVKHSCTPEALKRLGMQFYVYDPAYRFPNLEELDISIKMEDLPRLKEASPGLKKLRSFLREGETIDYSMKSIETVFGNLEQWKDTLEEVELLNPFDFERCWCCRTYRVDLPQLKVLTLRECPFDTYERVPAFQNLSPLVFQNWVRQIEIYRQRDEEFRETLRQVLAGNANLVDLFFRREPVRNN